MDQNQLRLAIRAWLTGVFASVVLLWLAFGRTFESSFWDSMAERPLGDAEATQLDRCEAPGWWTWLKVVRHDLPVRCGEVWVVEQLAEKIASHPARIQWVSALGAKGEPAPRTRMRVALGLLVAGQAAQDEPAWLLETLPAEERELWIAAAGESPVVAEQMGPRAIGLGALAQARAGDLRPAEVLPTLYWLGAVDDAEADAHATETAAALADVPADLGDRVRERRKAGRPIGGPAARFVRAILAHPECGARCGALYAEILDEVLTDAALNDGGEPVRDPPAPAALAELLTAAAVSAADRRAAAEGIRAAASWVRAAADPAARLRTLVARAPDPRWSIPRATWDGGGTPLSSALAFALIGEAAGVPVEVRADDVGALWFTIGGERVSRSCGEIGAPPDGSPWPVASLVAGALLERAQAILAANPAEARRLAVAAQRADPLIGGPLAVRLTAEVPREIEIGRRIGASLLGPLSVPTGGDAARRALGERGPPTCAPRVD